MSTFTTFERAALERYLVMFGVGDLVTAEPITAGIENSNYHVTTSHWGEDVHFVLTIVEDLSFDEVPFFSAVTTHLQHYGLPVPAPRRTLDGMSLTIFCGKPALLVPKLDGKHVERANAAQCRAIGKALAEMHKVLATQKLHRANPYDSLWQGDALAAVHEALGEDDRRMLADITTRYQSLEELDLPAGIIHGDLFRDNALFSGDRLTGVIDFYHACRDFFVQDLAICVNDWCRPAARSGIDAGLMTAMLEGYESVRPLEPEERVHLADFQLVACARFVLTRLMSGDGGQPLKDPREFLDLARWLYR